MFFEASVDFRRSSLSNEGIPRPRRWRGNLGTAQMSEPFFLEKKGRVLQPPSCERPSPLKNRLRARKISDFSLAQGPAKIAILGTNFRDIFLCVANLIAKAENVSTLLIRDTFLGVAYLSLPRRKASLRKQTGVP